MADLRIDVTPDPWAEAERDFVETARRVEAGDVVTPVNRLLLPGWEALAALLSPRRVALLSALRQEPAPSVKALAERLGRDRKNVYEDVRALEGAGLVERGDGMLVAPHGSVGASPGFAA